MTFDDGLEGLYRYALPILSSSRIPATLFLVAESLTPGGRAVDWIDGMAAGARQTITVDQILEMQEAGIAFGSHSYSHRDLRELSDAECEWDLRSSREVLEAILGGPVRTLAYPRGFHNERVRNAARRAGYSFAFGMDRTPEPGDHWSIPRIGVYGDNGLLTLRIKTSLWYPAVRWSLASSTFPKAKHR
jgi:peptidoglycan/xylan/chitin deacetylase (PgdA/CDA1 family)